MGFDKPRLMIAALRGGSGKTLVTMGLAAAWNRLNGLRVVPFKKGPDYIDAGWLSMAAGHPCYNLDPFLMEPADMLGSFLERIQGADVALIEGNRGLFDGVDRRGSYSSAELAKLLGTPVVLLVDATKVTRTAAAMVLGCRQLDPEVPLAGVILNRVAGKRHEQVLRGSIQDACGIPVLGVVPKDPGILFPERHMGLVPPQESPNVSEALDCVAHKIADCLDLQTLLHLARTVKPLGWPVGPGHAEKSPKTGDPVVVGIVRDAAFQFYYPENLEALQEKGAVLVEISSFARQPLPPLDALYIGGGFPETHLQVLADNEDFRASLGRRIEEGLPVYAECGGLMFLCREISFEGRSYPMVGTFPYPVVLEKKPQGHGYTVMECVNHNPFLAEGTTLKGHEFHYSQVLLGPNPSVSFIFRLKKGHGIVTGWDGLCYKNALASYSHIHAVGNDSWAEGMVRAARRHQSERMNGSVDRSADPDMRLSGACGYSTSL